MENDDYNEEYAEYHEDLLAEIAQEDGPHNDGGDDDTETN